MVTLINGQITGTTAVITINMQNNEVDIEQGGFMIVKKVTLIKIFWTQTIKNLKKIVWKVRKFAMTCKKSKKILWILVHFLLLIYN